MAFKLNEMLEEAKRRERERQQAANNDTLNRFLPSANVGRTTVGSGVKEQAETIWKKKSPVAAQQLNAYDKYKALGGKGLSAEATKQLFDKSFYMPEKLEADDVDHEAGKAARKELGVLQIGPDKGGAYSSTASLQAYKDHLAFQALHRGEGMWDVAGNSASVLSDSFLASQIAALGDRIAKSKKADDEWASTSAQKMAEYEAALKSAERWKQLYEERTRGYDDPEGFSKIENSRRWGEELAAREYNWLMADYLLGDQEQDWQTYYALQQARLDGLTDEEWDAEMARYDQQFQGLDWDALMNPEMPTYNSRTETLEKQLEQYKQEQSYRNNMAYYAALADRTPGTLDLDQYFDDNIDGYDPKWYNPEYFTNEAYYITHAAGNAMNIIEQLTDGMGEGIIKDLAGILTDEDAAIVRGYYDKGYDFLLPEEVAIYKGLLDTDPNMAKVFLINMEGQLRQRKIFYDSQETALLASDPVLGPVMTGITIMGKPYEAAQTIFGALIGADASDPGFDLARDTQTIRATRAQEWGKAIPIDVFGQPLGSTIFNTLVSLGDMLMSKKTGKFLTGGADKSAQYAMQTIMSSEVAADTIYEDLNDGYTNVQATIHGIANGLIEAWMESGFMDKLFDTGIGFSERVLGSTLAEGGEEFGTGIIQTVGDEFFAFLTGHESEIKQTYEAFKNSLPYGEDARVATLKYYANQFAVEGLSGAAMGGSMAAITGAPAAINNEITIRETGRTIQQNGDIEAVVRIAESMPENSESFKSAVPVRDALASGKKVPIRKLGKMVTAIANDIGEQNATAVNSVMEDAIQERLVELGEDSINARKLATVILSMYQGKQITKADRAAVNWTDNARQVVREMHTETTAEDAERTGHSWKANAYSRAQNVSLDAMGKNIRLRDAVTNKSSTASAVGKAMERANTLTKGNTNSAPKAIAFDDGTEGGNGTGEFKRVVKHGNETFVAIAKDGGETVEVPVEKLTFVGDDGLATIIEYAAYESRHEMSSEEVNILAASYEQQGGDVENFINAFESIYLSGYIGIDAAPSDMAPELQKIAYESGRKEAIKDEAHRVANAKNARKLDNPTFGWIGDVDSDSQITGIGDASALDEAMNGFTDSQRAMVELGNELGRAAGMNVVYFESKPDANGNITVQNGSYDPKTRTIYLDVNAGANTANERNNLAKSGTLGDAVGRLLGHEVTHVLESSSVEYYAKYKQAAKNALTDKGLDFAKLVREKIDAALAKGEKLTYAGAEAEVIADASEYMLQDSKFVQNLDTSLKGKVKAAIRDFIEKVNEAFRRLGMSGHVESRLLRTMTDGVAHYEKQLQDLWDMAFDEMLVAEVGSNTMTEDEEFSDVNTQFSIREEAPPKKTGIAYKVFFEKDGKLYPPMVANPGGADTPVGVWLNADIGASAPPSKTGRPQVQAGGKGTNASKMSLAFRPGWHLGDIPKATQFDRLNRATGVKELFPYNFVWAECEYAMDVDYQEEAMSYGYNANGKFQHSLAGLPRLPVDGYYHYRTNPNPNTVPWVITGAMKVNRVLSRQEVDDILREKGVEPTKWQGPNGEQMEVGGVENVTQADDGNVIPLSERFNADNEDIRYSLRYVDDNPVVWVDENILADKPDGQSDKVFIKDYLASHIDDVYTIIESGYKVFPSKKLPREYLYSKSATTLERFNKKKYKAKIAVVPGIGEMVGIATNRRWERLLHDANKKAKYGVYRYDTRVAFDNNGNSEAYTAELIILNAEDGKKYLYDIVGIKKDVAMSERLNERARSAEKTAYQDSNVNSSVARFYEDVKQKIQKSVRYDGSTYQSEAMTVADGMQDTDGKRMFSLRSFSEDYDTYRAMLLNHNVSVDEVNDLFDTIDEIMKAIEKDRDILDFGWNVGREDRSFSPVKPNSDPLYEVSLDFSTLCRKRLLQQTVQDRLESMYDTVLTKAERVAIRNELMKLREEGKQIEVACALCYVESTRLKSPAQIQRFFDDRRAVMVDYFSKKNKAYMKEVNARSDELIVKFGHEPGTKKNKLNSFQKKAVENLKQSMYKKYTPSAEEEAIITTALELPGESFKTEKGLWNLKKEHEEIFDAYTSFVRNATKSKGIEGDEAWWAGDSKSISDKLIEKMNKENGLRTQSWSDFQVIHLLDYISAIIELSTRGAKMQSYTKVPDFVKLMGDTGVMINLSLIPKGFDGTLNYDPIEGMPIEEALALREMFPNTVGTICIGITERHIRMLLADPNTDYVIPYHSSSLDKKTRQLMGMKVWEDFQSYQNEKNKDYHNTVYDNKTYRKKPLFSEWFDYNTVSERAKVVGAERAMQEAADRYIELCHRRGLQEKFAQFATEPNYWKLLIDRKMINQQTGEIIKQEAVQPRFNKDRILDILSAEVNRFKAQNADKDAAVEHIVKAWENGEIRKASKSKKVIDQVSAFNDTVTVANIVASAAELDAQEHTQKSIRDLPEDTVTYRDYLTEADSSIAATIEERNALSIYQKLLKNHAEASEKVIEAEAALAAADEANKPEARKALAAARVKQKDLYNRLLNVERQAHVQTLVKRSNQIIGDLYGKDQSALDKMLADKEHIIASLKADLTGLKGAARTQREADIREQEREMAALKSKATKALLANSERYQQKMQEIRDRRDINIEIGKRQRHIKRVVKRLNDRIVHEEDYRNIKEQMKPAVHELVRTFIDGFGNLVFDSKSADRLRRVYDAIANEDAAPEFYSNDVSDMLTELAELAEKDANRRAEGSSAMSALQEKLDTYAKVAEIADHINKMVTAADEVFVNGKRENFATISAEVGNGLTAIEDKTLWVGKARDAIRVADDLLRTGNMTPSYFFKHLNNSGLSKLFEGLMTGQTEYAQAIRQGQDAILDAKRRYNFHSWHHMKKGVEFRTDQGHTISLTTPQMMWVYATAKREATNSLMDTHHLDQGGFRYEAKDLPRQNGKITAIPGIDRLHKLSAADVKKITDTLTAEQKACADELVSYLSNECAEQGNRASMELFGIRKYKESYYFPFKTASDQRYQHSAAGSTSTTNDARVKHTSFTHSLRKGANTPLVMGDFFQVISDHINEMATYASFVVPIESMNRVLNAKVNEEADGSGNDVTIRSLLGRKHGETAQKYIADLMKDLNGGPQTDNRGTVSALFRAFKRGAVMGSLSVSLQQPTAIARAFAYVNPKYFAHITMEGNKKTWERMMKHSGTAVIKDMGKFDVGTGKMANDWIANADLQDFNVWKRGKFLLDTQGFNAFKNNWVEWATQLPGVMDRITWTHIWKAIEAEQAEAHPGMDRNSNEFQNLVGKRFDYVINQTQVYDSILSKSQNMRSKNPFAQMSTAFMAEPTLNINMLYDALTGKHTPGERASIVASVAASSILAAAMASLIAAWNKDDDDRKWQEKYLSEFASRAVDGVNPMTMIPYVADVWSMMNGYDIERTDLSVLKDLIDYADTFISKAKDPDKANTWRDYENLFGSIANLTGIPAKNVSRDIRRVRNFLATDKSASSKATLKYTLLENIMPLGLYDDSNKAYYQRLVSALMDGDTQESYDLREYLTQSKGVEENTVNEGVRNAYRDEYKRGGIDKQTAINFLLDHNLVSGDNADKKKQKAFQYVDKWDEGTDGYSAYNTLKDAFSGGDSSNIQTAWQELTSNGYTDDQIKSQAKTLLKELVQNGAISTTQATELLRKYAPYVNDKDNLNKPNEWLGK